MKVQEALTAVMSELPAIGKEGRGPKDQGGYAYRGIEQITREVQPLLAKYGVIIAPKAFVISIQPAPGMKETWTTTVLAVTWYIIGPEGDAIEAQTIGIGRDSFDKQANKAMSQAFKYLLLDLFCISDAKDDSDGADYSSGIAPPPPAPPPDTPGVIVFRRIAGKPPEVQAALRALKNDERFKGRKITVPEMDAHPDWLDAIVEVLDNAEPK